jgi:hypothetical protein
METTMRFLCAALLLLAGVGTAAANIRIETSRYVNGTLTIAGQTEPNKAVVLDGKYKTKSDADGDFRFTEHYKPFTCMSDIRSGSSTYSAVIAGCLDPNFDGDTTSIDQLPPVGSPKAPLPVKKAAVKPKH